MSLHVCSGDDSRLIPLSGTVPNPDVRADHPRTMTPSPSFVPPIAASPRAFARPLRSGRLIPPNARPANPRLPRAARASANHSLPRAPPTRASPRTRSWKPLTVFSVSPFEEERASRVLPPRRAARAHAGEPDAPTAVSARAQTARPAESAPTREALAQHAGAKKDPAVADATSAKGADDAVVEASPAAVGAHSWPRFDSHAALLSHARALRDDPLAADGGRIVLHRGSPTARLVIVGEAPGAEEDRQRLPFVGRSGQLLDRILRYAGFDPEKDVYVTNVVKRRPKGNRPPTAEEVRYYAGLLREEVRLVRPAIVVMAGRTAIDALMPGGGAISRMRGKWFEVEGVPAMPVFHPAYLLRNPEAKKLMKDDVLAIRKRFLEDVPGAELGGIRNQGSS